MTRRKLERTDELVDIIMGTLAGQEPEVQGAIIANLVAMFIAGHAPPLRKEAKELLLQCVNELIPICVSGMIEKGRVPPEWAQQ
jgi:hypothetical protein